MTTLRPSPQIWSLPVALLLSATAAAAQWTPPDGVYESTINDRRVQVRVAEGKLETFHATYVPVLTGNALVCLGGAQPRELEVNYDARRQGPPRPVTSDEVAITVGALAAQNFLVEATVSIAAVAGEAALTGSTIFQVSSRGTPSFCRSVIRAAQPENFLARRVSTLAGGPVTNTVDSVAARAAMTTIPLRPYQIVGQPADQVVFLLASGAEGRQQLYRASSPDSLWQPMLPGATAGLVAVHPTRPSVVTAITRGRVSRSEDGGATWRELRLPVPHVSVLGISERLPDVIYAAESQQPLIRSLDGGRTWTTLRERAAWRQIVGSPTNPDVVYAVATGGNDARLLRSDDAGGSWRQLQRGDGINGFAIDSAESDVLYLAIRRSNRLGDAGELMRSPDGGRTWQRIAIGGGRLGVDRATHTLYVGGRVVRRLLPGTAVLEEVSGGMPENGEVTRFSFVGPRPRVFATVFISLGANADYALFELVGREWRRVDTRAAR